MKNWTIGKKLWFLSICLLGNAVIIGGISYWNSDMLVEELNLFSHTQISATKSMTLADMMHDGIRANAFHAILVSRNLNPKAIKEIREESEEFGKNIVVYLEEVEKANVGAEVNEAVAPAKAAVSGYVTVAKQIVDFGLSGRTEAAMALMPTLQVKFEELEVGLGKLGDLVEKDTANETKIAETAARRAQWIGIGVLVLGLALGFFVAWGLVRNTRESLTQVIQALSQEAGGISHAAEDLNSASQALASATTEQASALQETAASVDEITAMVKKTGENSVELDQAAQASQKAATRGQEAITEMLSAIATIRDSNAQIMKEVDESNTKISDIVKVIGEITNKTKVINDIVFQTKLLSFNASVEAARAGEHGKGFAVVAEEVGNLAQMSGNAAKDISDMLTNSMQTVEKIVTENRRRVEGLMAEGKGKVDRGSEVAQQCGVALEEILKQAGEVNNMIGEITTAIQEQNQGIQEISKAVGLMDQTTHANSQTSQQTSGAASSLYGQSKSLTGIVESLQRMVTGTGGAQSPAPTVSGSGGGGTMAAAAPSTAPSNVISFPKPKSDGPAKAADTGMPLKAAVGGSEVPSANDPRFEDV